MYQPSRHPREALAPGVQATGDTTDTTTLPETHRNSAAERQYQQYDCQSPMLMKATASAMLDIRMLPNEVLALVCCNLGSQDLGRLACVARKFAETFVAVPCGGAGHKRSQCLSLPEEGARLQLIASAADCEVSQFGEATWLRALWQVEHPVVFVSCGPGVVLSTAGEQIGRLRE